MAKETKGALVTSLLGARVVPLKGLEERPFWAPWNDRRPDGSLIPAKVVAAWTERQSDGTRVMRMTILNLAGGEHEGEMKEVYATHMRVEDEGS